ncbi:transposase, partial [Candidatus Bipolaricaulota bacterium]
MEYEGALYHVTSRGNAREAIFTSDADRSRFLEILEEVIDRFSWLCYGYCLMSNHYHILIETPDANLSRGMQLLNGVYTQWYNREHDRVGHLYQGRFKAILVEKENHLLEVARYIVLNPLRAKMVKRVDGWPWSSYHATAGRTEVPTFLEVDWLLSQFDPACQRAMVAYRQFVKQGHGINVWDDLRGGSILGSDGFIASIHPWLDKKPFDPEYRKHERLVARPS